MMVLAEIHGLWAPANLIIVKARQLNLKSKGSNGGPMLGATMSVFGGTMGFTKGESWNQNIRMLTSDSLDFINSVHPSGLDG